MGHYFVRGFRPFLVVLALGFIPFSDVSAQIQNVITTVVGNGLLGDGSPATSGLLGSAVGVAVDSSGNIYISDQTGRISKMNASTGNISTFAGTGIPGYSGDNGPATSAALNLPTALAVDGAGNRASRTALPGTTASNFSYDAIYELTKVMQGTSTTESYSYDAVGNRLTAPGVSSWTHNSSNELTARGTWTYTWDANGNLTTQVVAGTSTFTWDPSTPLRAGFENRLMQANQPFTPPTVTLKI